MRFWPNTRWRGYACNLDSIALVAEARFVSMLRYVELVALRYGIVRMAL